MAGCFNASRNPAPKCSGFNCQFLEQGLFLTAGDNRAALFDFYRRVIDLRGAKVRMDARARQSGRRRYCILVKRLAA